MKKAWWRSKTLWLNFIGLAALVVQTQTGFVVSPEIQTAILGAVNLALRLITNEAVGLQDETGPAPAGAPPDGYGPDKGTGA